MCPPVGPPINRSVPVLPGFPSNRRRRTTARPSEHMHTMPARTATASPLRRPKLSRSCLECVCKVDNSPEGQPSENNARNERRTETVTLRYHVGLHTVHGGPGQGRARGPLTLRLADAGDVRLRGTRNNRQAVLSTGWVPAVHKN